LLVRPLNERGFEIVAGARRYRAAQMAEAETVPVRIVNLTDAEALEAQLVENLIRADVHPMEEANGFRALLNLEEPKYSIEQISARTGKTPAFVASRLKLTELSPVVVDAFYREEIGTGHALLLAKLQPAQQEEALSACYQEQYGSNNKTKRTLLPVRHLQQWIEHNILLELASAPFSKKMRSLCRRLVLASIARSAPGITSYSSQTWEQGRRIHAQTRNAMPRSWTRTSGRPSQRNRSWYKSARAMVSRRKAAPRFRETSMSKSGRRSPRRKKRPHARSSRRASTPPRPLSPKASRRAKLARFAPRQIARCITPRSSPVPTIPKWNAEEQKRRREEALAQATGLRTLAAIVAAVPVRLMKRDLLFVVERLAALLDERRLEIVARQRGIKKAKDSDSIGKLFTAYLRHAEEGALSGLLVEITILHAATRQNAAQVLRDATTAYKVDVDAISLKVKQEFAAKEKAKLAPKPAAKAVPPKARKAA
jgi:ParB family chromosome partitioning protein